MSKIIHLGNAVFVDTDPVDPPEGSEAPPEGHIYPYAEFRSLEHVSYGLRLTAGGPRGEEVDSIEVGQYGMEPLSPYWEFGDALKEIGRGASHAFEDVPYVEIETEEQYNEVLDALKLEEDEGDIFDGPGLYDFRDSPPTYQGTVEDNELEDMSSAADDAFDFMFQGEEWEDAYGKLAEDDGTEDETEEESE